MSAPHVSPTSHDPIIHSPFTPGLLTTRPGVDLFGRAAELQVFDRLLVELSTGIRTPRPLVIEGHPGSGKTTLLQAFERRAEEIGIATVWAKDDAPSSTDTGAVVFFDGTSPDVWREFEKIWSPRIAVVAAWTTGTAPEITVEHTRITLSVYDQATAEVALALPVIRAGGSWEPATLRAAATLARDPLTAIRLGAAMWREAREENPASPHITERHFRTARRKVFADREPIYRELWDRTTPAERRLLTTMVELGHADIARHRIAERMGVETDAIGVARQALIDKGVLTPRGRGLLGFTTPGFADWVRARKTTA